MQLSLSRWTKIVAFALVATLLPASEASATHATTCNGVRATIVGSSGSDRLIGTSGRDVIAGLGGDDVILGRGGNDLICGGPGSDTIRGSWGNDTLYGGNGGDTIQGGPGQDEISAGAGNDEIQGGKGSDTIRGGSGNDFVRGNQGRDVIQGNLGRDRLLGGKHVDTIDGGLGVDTINGGEGRDSCENGEKVRACTVDAAAFADLEAPSSRGVGRTNWCPTGGTRITYFFGASFTPTMKQAVRRALDTWEESFVLLFVEVQSQGEAVTVFDLHPFTHFADATVAAHGNPIAGCAGDQSERGDVHFSTFYDWESDQDLEAFTLHEVGHILGFVGHHEGAGHVMSDDPTRHSFSAVDLAAFDDGYRRRPSQDVPVVEDPPDQVRRPSLSVSRGGIFSGGSCGAASPRCRYVNGSGSGWPANEQFWVRCGNFVNTQRNIPVTYRARFVDSGGRINFGDGICGSNFRHVIEVWTSSGVRSSATIPGT